MGIPCKKDIETRARELFHIDRARSGEECFSIEPELSELAESGFLASAKSELMYSLETKNEEWLERAENFAEKEATNEPSEIPFDVSLALDSGFFVSGTSQSGKTTLAKHLAKRLIDTDVVVYVIDPSRAWLHDSPIKQAIPIYEMEGTIGPWFGSTVFDVSTLNVRDQIAFTNTLCSALNQRHIDGETVYKEFVVFEEAQTYLPNGGMRLGTRRVSPLEGVFKLVTVGANYGLRFGAICQFPAMVDKSVVKMCQQRYFGWTWEKNDVQYLKAFLGKEWAAKLQGLQKGEFIHQNRMSTSLIRTPIFKGAPEPKTQATNWFNYEFKNLEFLYTKTL